MPMYLTVVEEGDIILVRGGNAKAPMISDKLDEDSYYIMRDHKLIEVPWYEAFEYQQSYAEEVRKRRGFSPVDLHQGGTP